MYGTNVALGLLWCPGIWPKQERLAGPRQGAASWADERLLASASKRNAGATWCPWDPGKGLQVPQNTPVRGPFWHPWEGLDGVLPVYRVVFKLPRALLACPAQPVWRQQSSLAGAPASW